MRGGLFAGNIQNAPRASFFAHGSGRLYKQGGFSDARLAPDKNGRALYRAAAQHAVELFHTGGKTRTLNGIYCAQGQRLYPFAPPDASACRRLRIVRRTFDKRIPLAAVGTASHPPRLSVPARSTFKKCRSCFSFYHFISLFKLTSCIFVLPCASSSFRAVRPKRLSSKYARRLQGFY